MCRSFFTGLSLALVAFSVGPAFAQDTDNWSAIETPSPGSPARRTVAPSGAGAPLQPNAAMPSTNQHLKTAGRPLANALDGILRLRPLQYSFLPGQGAEGTHYGVSPAELAKVYPELVKTDLLTGVQSINTSQLTPILIEAIKEQQQQIVILQQQQLQLAQAYAQLAQGSPRPAGPVGFLRRGRADSAKKNVLLNPTMAPDSISLVP